MLLSQVCLTALENLLAEDEIRDETIYQIEECGGLDDLEALQQSDQQIIYQMSYDLLTNYFNSVFPFFFVVLIFDFYFFQDDVVDDITADNQFTFNPLKPNQHFHF